MNKKICRDCGERKDIDQFGQVLQRRKEKTYGPYYSPYCKACAVLRASKHRKAHPRPKSLIPTGRPLTPHVTAMLDAMCDGQWHGFDEIIQIGARAVPPGIAYRRGEAMRQRKRAAPGERTRGDDSDSVAMGSRFIARQSLMSHVRSGRCERDGDQIRRVK